MRSYKAVFALGCILIIVSFWLFSDISAREAFSIQSSAAQSSSPNPIDLSSSTFDMASHGIRYTFSSTSRTISSPQRTIDQDFLALQSGSCGTPAADDCVDLGEIDDEQYHNLAGWAGIQTNSPIVSPSGDTSKRYQWPSIANSLELYVPAANAPYNLLTEVEDGGCDDSFEIYVNGQGPIYTYHADPEIEDVALLHTISISDFLVPTTTVTITYQNISSDGCGLAAVFNAQLVVAPLQYQKLIEDYAPLIFDHGEELYWPIAIEPPVAASDLYYGPGEPVEHPTLPMLADSTYNKLDSYLDFDPAGRDAGDTEEYWKSVKYQPEWQPQIYARVLPQGDKTVIQYWFFYYDNPSASCFFFCDFLNHHEGDWEKIQVVLDQNDEPEYVAYSQHEQGTKRLWEYVDTFGTHPKVYVAKGTHASYFKPFPYRIPLPFPLDRLVDDSPGAELIVTSNTPILLSGNEEWLQFVGHWGYFSDDDFSEYNDGPNGPKQKNEWGDPLTWSNNLEWDELSEINNYNKLFCRSSYPVEVSLRDKETGKFVGRLPDGTIVEQIANSEYFDNPGEKKRTILVHEPEYTDSDYFDYLCQLEHNFSVAPLSRKNSPKGAGTLNASSTITVTYNVPHYASDQVTMAEFTTALPISATAIISSVSESEISLLVDEDGDGETDYTVPPNTLQITDVDFTPPGIINDLAVIDTSPGSATLTWTATGDDDDSGTTLGYEIRYFAKPLTTTNWISATLITDSPIPSPANSLESFRISNLPPGTLYFAIRTVDDAFQYSQLSNGATAEIPAHRVYLPMLSKTPSP